MKYRNKETGEIVEVKGPETKLTHIGLRQVYTVYKVDFIIAPDLFTKTYEPVEDTPQ